MTEGWVPSLARGRRSLHHRQGAGDAPDVRSESAAPSALALAAEFDSELEPSDPAPSALETAGLETSGLETSGLETEQPVRTVLMPELTRSRRAATGGDGDAAA